MFLRRFREEKDLLGRVVRTHVQLSIPDRGIFAYGRMERLGTDSFQSPQIDLKPQDLPEVDLSHPERVTFVKAPASILRYEVIRSSLEGAGYRRVMEPGEDLPVFVKPKGKITSVHATNYFRVKRSLTRRNGEIILASQDQDLIADSPTVSARNTARGNAIIKLMMMVVIGMVPLLDFGMLSVITNPQISSAEVYNTFFFMTIGVAVAVVLIFTVYYMLGFIDVHLVDCEALDNSKAPGPIPVYLSHPDRGKAVDQILHLARESRDVLNAHAEAARLLNTEKILELSYIAEKLEHEADSLKMSLQTMRRRGEDASRFTRKGSERRQSAWPVAAAILIVGVILTLIIVYG